MAEALRYVHLQRVIPGVTERCARGGETGRILRERQDRLTGGQLGRAGSGRRQARDLGQDQVGDLGGGVIAGLGTGGEQALVASDTQR